MSGYSADRKMLTIHNTYKNRMMHYVTWSHNNNFIQQNTLNSKQFVLQRAYIQLIYLLNILLGGACLITNIIQRSIS